VPAFLVADLAWNNGPNEIDGAARPPSKRCCGRQSATRCLGACEGSVSATARSTGVELTGLGFHWPNASLVPSPAQRARLQTRALFALTAAATGAEGHRRAAESSASISPLFPSYRSTWPTFWACASSRRGRRSRPSNPKLRPGELNLLGFLWRPVNLYENQARHAARAVRGPRGVGGFRRAAEERGMAGRGPAHAVLLDAS
jgi:hypothetical protein